LCNLESFGVSEVLVEECGARVAKYPNFILESADSPLSSEGGTSLFTKYCVEDDWKITILVSVHENTELERRGW
jgi:hypothetical protein